MEPTIQEQVLSEGIDKIHEYVATTLEDGLGIVCPVAKKCPSSLALAGARFCSKCIYSPPICVLKEITPNLTPENYIDTVIIYRTLV